MKLKCICNHIRKFVVILSFLIFKILYLYFEYYILKNGIALNMFNFSICYIFRVVCKSSIGKKRKSIPAGISNIHSGYIMTFMYFIEMFY